ncbi:MAG: response regulator transcription factor [Clostridiales bacterium]|nr:response regulator transcription factor [Clostridiales bacterium]
MIEKANILVVEDDNEINNMLAILLSKSGYNVRQAYSGTEAKLYLEQTEFHLVLLDLMIPGINGEQLLLDIRATKQMPIIVITAKLDKQLKLDLLRAGADDYIIKPFDLEEVSARVYSNIRRYLEFSNATSVKERLSHKDIVMDKSTKEVWVNSKLVTLTAREFAILELLLSHPKKVFTKANLFESVWGDEYLGDDNTVNVHMSNLRNKLTKANPQEEYIETIWGMGYRLKG